MRPGEILPGAGPVPEPPAVRRETVRIRNTGRHVAYLGSHFPLVDASAALSFDRTGLAGATVDLPSGATARIGPGVEVELTAIWRQHR